MSGRHCEVIIYLPFHLSTPLTLFCTSDIIRYFSNGTASYSISCNCNMRRCLVGGISGRDGVYLTQFLTHSFSNALVCLLDTLTVILLICQTEKVLKDLKQRPVPVFQRLFFIDLPVEILDNIISLVTVSQAKTLSCTCRAVNDISQRYIFRVRCSLVLFPLVALTSVLRHGA